MKQARCADWAEMGHTLEEGAPKDREGPGGGNRGAGCRGGLGEKGWRVFQSLVSGQRANSTPGVESAVLKVADWPLGPAHWPQPFVATSAPVPTCTASTAGSFSVKSFASNISICSCMI